MEELQGHDIDLLGILPRGHMKTTIVSKAYVLWLVVTEQLHFVAIFSNTDAQATGILSDISRNLNQNARIRAVYGDVLSPKVTRVIEGKIVEETVEVTDNDHEIVTNTGICVRVAGSGTETRGWNYGSYRPELIIGDDIESRDTVTTLNQRDKLELWWDADVQPMRDLRRSRIIIVGTVLHIDSVLARKRKKGAYRVFFRKAIINEPTHRELWDQWAAVWNEQGGKKAAEAYYRKHEAEMLRGTEVLWPEGLPYLRLAEKRKELGPFAFQTEYQNEPVASDSVVIKAEWVKHRPRYIAESQTILDGTEVIELKDLSLYGSVDVAISQKEGADYFVFTTGGRDPTGRIYILDVFRAHLSAPDQIRAILRLFRQWQHNRIAIEAVAYQRALKQMVDEQSAATGDYVPTIDVIPDKDKIRRLTRWQPLFEQGTVRVCDVVPSSCVEELTTFPLADHDDVPDSISMLLDLIADQNNAAELTTFTFDG